MSTPDRLEIDHTDVTDIAADCGLEILTSDSWEAFLVGDNRRPEFERGAGAFCVRAVRLKGLAGTLAWPTQPGRVFADELRGRVRVIAALDQLPILLDSEAWPSGETAHAALETLCQAAGCTPEDGLVVIWGAEQDTLTAAEEIRLRYLDAMDGVPNETRQPFEDGSTDFERILPGPDRMYPDTDSPPQRITRERVEGLGAALAERPWLREERYAAVGVPRDVIHYLIRRGGARLVDMVVVECDADLRRACFFFGERVKGLRREGLLVDTVADESWCDLFSLCGVRPVIWEAWRDLVEWLITHPDGDVFLEAALAGLGIEPKDWSETVAAAVESSLPDEPLSKIRSRAGTRAVANGREGINPSPTEISVGAGFIPARVIANFASGSDDTDGDSDRRFRFLMGEIMDELRGRVPAARVAADLQTLLTANDPATMV